MGFASTIQWTDHTFNPWWGCQKVSPGCEHCYAEAFDHRVGGVHWGASAERRFFGEKHWREPLLWNTEAMRRGERERVFCASMADVFERRPELAFERDTKLWPLIESTPALDWLLLSKRPEEIEDAIPGSWLERDFPPNVWLGVSVEDNKRADERIHHLVRWRNHARVLFLSCEPLLERLDLSPWMSRAGELQFFDWVIVGGESGGGARPCELSWIDALVHDCRAAGVACFVKQLGSKMRPKIATDDRKAGDWDDWPLDLRIREFPRPQKGA